MTMKTPIHDSFNIDELLSKVERRKQQQDITKAMKPKKKKKGKYIY